MVQNKANVAFIIGHNFIIGIRSKITIFFHASYEHNSQHGTMKDISCFSFGSIIELTTCFHEFSEYEWTSLLTIIFQLKKKTNFLLVKKGIFSQFWAFEKIKTNITEYLVEKIRRFIFWTFVKTCRELDLYFRIYF